MAPPLPASGQRKMHDEAVFRSGLRFTPRREAEANKHLTRAYSASRSSATVVRAACSSSGRKSRGP